MPTVFEANGYRFFFYSNENNEPMHIHVSKGSAEAKYWMNSNLEESFAYGFKVRERKEIRSLIKDNAEKIDEKWTEFFK
jgi:hypothetical protein